MATRYTRLLVATLLISTSLWLFSKFGPELPEPPPKRIIPNTPEENPPPHTNATLPGQGVPLKPHGIKNLHEDADITTIRLHANFTTAPIPLYQEVQAFLPRFAKIDSPDFGLAPYSWRVNIAVPKGRKKVDASTLVFGIATTLPRLDDNLIPMQHWAAHTGAKIVAIINPKDDHNKMTVEEVTESARMMGIDLEIVEREANIGNRYMLLVKVLHQYAIPETQWAAILDDDTFFPSMSRLLRMLHKHNYREHHYIGGLTEDGEAIAKWGYMAYSGGGIFFSRGFLDQLQVKFDQCNAIGHNSPDGRLAECIYKYTTTKFTWEKGLWQFDIFGDYSGVFEAVRPLPLSIHHWKSWGEHDMVLASKISKVCGENCIFQKIQLSDGWFITNGFSIVKFSEKGKDDRLAHNTPQILTHQEGSMERTWKKVADEAPTKFWHSLSPLRPKDEGKRSYILEAAVEEDDWSMTLYYVKREDELATGIIRVIWTRDWDT